MTFVAARRFNQRVIMIADTKIANGAGIGRSTPRSPRMHNNIPGRLKVFPITRLLSVGYAGFSDQALLILRGLKSVGDDEQSLEEALEYLRAGSKNGHADFLVVSHIRGPEIFKMQWGRVSGSQDAHWIGDGRIASLLTDSIDSFAATFGDQMRRSNQLPITEFGEVDEVLFTVGWMNLLLEAPTFSDTIGGLPVALLASPYGHCFLPMAGAYNPDPISINSEGQTTNERGELVDALYGQYSFSFVDGGARGAAVLGVSLREAGAAYLYAPLTDDEALPIKNVPFDKIREFVTAQAIRRGGMLMD